MHNVEKIILGVSWWPDSMYLSYRLEKKYWKDKLIICNYNHNFRKESKKESEFIKKYFESKWIKFIYWEYNWNNFKEENLRKKRYDFFKENWWWKYYLALWHNLTDRIETTFLNIARWTGIFWFLNMKKIDNKNKIYRPLIDITKKDIQKECDKLNIPYFIDKSNKDSSISKRNFIRNNIFPLFEELNEDYFYNFNKIYKQIEWILPEFDLDNYLEKIEDNMFILKKLPKNNKEYFIRELFWYFWQYNFRSWVFVELINYIENSKWWWFKKYWNIYFYKKNNIITIKNWQ